MPLTPCQAAAATEWPTSPVSTSSVPNTSASSSRDRMTDLSGAHLLCPWHLIKQHQGHNDRHPRYQPPLSLTLCPATRTEWTTTPVSTSSVPNTSSSSRERMTDLSGVHLLCPWHLAQQQRQNDRPLMCQPPLSLTPCSVAAGTEWPISPVSTSSVPDTSHSSKNRMTELSGVHLLCPWHLVQQQGQNDRPPRCPVCNP